MDITSELTDLGLIIPPSLVEDKPKDLMCVTCGTRVSPDDMYLHQVPDYPIMCVGPIFVRMAGEPVRGDWKLADAHFVIDQRNSAYNQQELPNDE